MLSFYRDGYSFPDHLCLGRSGLGFVGNKFQNGLVLDAWKYNINDWLKIHIVYQGVFFFETNGSFQGLLLVDYISKKNKKLNTTQCFILK